MADSCRSSEEIHDPDGGENLDTVDQKRSHGDKALDLESVPRKSSGKHPDHSSGNDPTVKGKAQWRFSKPIQFISFILTVQDSLGTILFFVLLATPIDKVRNLYSHIAPDLPG